MTTVTISGLRETLTAMKAMETKLAKRAMRKALQAGVNVLGEAIKAVTPTRTGLTKESVGTAVSIANTEGSGVAVVGFGKQGFRARMVEFGHQQLGHKPNKTAGKRVPAHPFIRPAFDSSKEAAVEAFATVIKQEAATK